MKRLFVVNQKHVNVMLPSGEMELWFLLWVENSVRGRGSSKNCYIGFGWYGLIETLQIPSAHRLRFRSQSNENFVRLEVVEDEVGECET